MAKVKIQGHASGTGVLTVTAPNTSTDRTITLPDATGTLLNSDGDGSSLTGVADATKLPLAGGTLTGNVTVSASGADASRTLSLQGTNGSSELYQFNLIADGGNSAAKFMIGSGGGAASEKLRIQSGGGISFNGDTAAANALDDYEEGTWTPTVTCTTSGSYTLDGGSNLLAYTKVGRVVHISGYIQINGESSPNGNLRITLPFTSFNSTDDTDYAMGNAIIANHGGNMPSNINFFVTNNSAYGYPWGVNDNGTTFYVAHDDVDTNFQFGVSMTYIAA